jgi:hypothetical protein
MVTVKKARGRMSYSIKVNKDVIAAIEALPVSYQAEIIRLFKVIIHGGHTHLPPPMVAYRSENMFSIKAYANRRAIDFSKGVLLVGFYKKAFDGEYFIATLDQVDEANNICGVVEQAKLLRSVSPKADTAEYIEITKDWLANKEENPFFNKAVYEGSNRKFVLSSTLVEITNMFYPCPASLSLTLRSMENIGGLPPFPSPIMGVQSPIVKRFDMEFHERNPDLSIKDYLGNCLNSHDSICFVNFIDETKCGHRGNPELSILMGSYIKKIYPSIKVRILDVVVIDAAKNRTPYFDGCLEFNSIFVGSSTALGSRVLARVNRNTEIKQKVVPIKKGKLISLSFDLFPKDLDIMSGLMEDNVNDIARKVFEIAGKTSAAACVQERDLRGRDVNYELMYYGYAHKEVIVRVAGDDDDYIRVAKHACQQALLSGCPDVVLVREDGPPRIRIASDSNCFMEYNNLRNISGEFNLDKYSKMITGEIKKRHADMHTT